MSVLHSRKSLSASQNHRNTPEKVPQPLKYHCHKCDMGFRLKTHMDIHYCMSRNAYICELCQSGPYPNFKELNEHHKVHNREFFPLHFSDQDKPTLQPSEDPVQQSLEKVPKSAEPASSCKVSGQFDCDICGKVLKNKLTFKTHKLAHTRGSLLSCQTCGKGCMTKILLQRHMKTHTKEALPFHCKDCGKVYARENFYKAHILTHKQTGAAHGCTECGKKFATKSNLAKHAYVHTR